MDHPYQEVGEQFMIKIVVWNVTLGVVDSFDSFSSIFIL